MRSYKVHLRELHVLNEAIEHADLDISLFNTHTENNAVYFFLNEEREIKLMEALDDYLIYAGFDLDYQLNEKGRILEDLIDRLE